LAHSKEQKFPKTVYALTPVSGSLEMESGT
jgi:hypothetical protein